jgi:hypothetical protein
MAPRTAMIFSRAIRTQRDSFNAFQDHEVKPGADRSPRAGDPSGVVDATGSNCPH